MLVNARRLAHPDRNARVILLSMVDATERQRGTREGRRHRRAAPPHEEHAGGGGALARQTKTAERSAEAYRDAFLGRLNALIRANGLSMDSDEPVALDHLVRVTLEPYAAAPDRVELAPAPDVALHPDQVRAGQPVPPRARDQRGQVRRAVDPDRPPEIGWTVGPSTGRSKDLTLTWREAGGPEVATPDTPGFGTRLIDFAVMRDLNGSVERSYGSDGLSVKVEVPL